MSRLIVTTFVTLDGVMQAPGGPEEDPSSSFRFGGWQMPLWDDDAERLMLRWMAAADGFLLGRKTYEIFAGYWPKVTDPADAIAGALNSLPKYVVSNTLKNAEWNNSTIIRGDVAAQIKQLKQKPGRELQVHGSANLIQTLLTEDLIDEVRLWTYPIALGTGKRFFGEGTTPAAYRLMDSTRTAKGALVNRYERNGDVQLGSFDSPDTR